MQLGQTVNVFLVLLLYTCLHIYTHIKHLRIEQFIRYIYTFHRYWEMLYHTWHKRVLPEVGDHQYLQIWWNIRAVEKQDHLWADYRSCSKDGYDDPRGSKYQTCLEKGCTETEFAWQVALLPGSISEVGRFTAFYRSPVNHPVLNFHHVKTDSTIQPADQTHNFQKVKAFLMLG